MKDLNHCSPQAIQKLQKITRLPIKLHRCKSCNKEHRKLLKAKTHLHQDARPLRGREGNFVHKMRDVPGRKKN